MRVGAILPQLEIGSDPGAIREWVSAVEALGVPFENRGERMEEQIRVMKQLWSQPLVTLQEAHHNLNQVGLNPLPQRPIPLWMGATSPVGFRRVVALADGWICPGGALSP